MASTNQGPEYFAAEKRYLYAQTSDEKIYWLEEMMRGFKKHKGSEKMFAELKKRLIKLKEKTERIKKAGKGKKGIRKEGYQVVLIGLTNSGKSTLLSKLTNARPEISEYEFTTKQPELGTMDYEGVKAQIIDLPSVGSREFDYSILHSADYLLLVIENLGDLEKINEFLSNLKTSKLIVINKMDKLNYEEKRKLEERCKAKRLNYVLISAKNEDGLDNLKKKIFESMKVIRVYTKEPGKEKSKEPIILKEGASVKEVADSIYKGFSIKVKETRLTGPSGKFSNQKVGLNHVCKDMDVVEFRT